MMERDAKVNVSSRILGRAGGGGAPEFSQGITVSGSQTLVFIAGQVAVDERGDVVGGRDAALQAARVFQNLGALLEEAGAAYEDVVSFTTYLTAEAHIPDFVAFRHEAFPALFPNGRYPTNTLLVVSALARPEFIIEVSAVAVTPLRSGGG